MLAPYLHKNTIEAGCDEAGRGCLAGAVFAAAVILPTNFVCPDLNDSKKMTLQQRNNCRRIIEKEAIAWAVAQISPEEIDKINILNASFLAMEQAVNMLHTKPTYLLIDGNRFRPIHTSIPYSCIIKGDAKFMSIAAASVLAKTHRDEYMNTIHLEYPQYDWNKNKGYPTQKHQQAILAYGRSKYHRQTFRITSEKQLTLKL